MRLVVVTVLMVLGMAVTASAQVKNPTRAIFNPGPDNAQATGYELEFYNPQGVSIQKFAFPVQTPDVTTGDVSVTFNVQPIKFDSYTARVRLVFPGGLVGPDSPPSDAWERSPGPPGKPRFTVALEGPVVPLGAMNTMIQPLVGHE